MMPWILSFLLLIMTGCVSAGAGFTRVLGAADHLPIPLYQGVPPVIYTHVKLGPVVGNGGVWSSLAEQKYRASFNIATMAQEKGGNAVVGLVGKSTSAGFVYTGEAVRFDLLPPDPERKTTAVPRDPKRGN